MKVLLLGSNGSMGKRYQAILRYLQIDFITYDIKGPSDLSNLQLNAYVKNPNLIDITHAIVATPTDYHMESVLPICTRTNWNVLCEKPISTNINDLIELNIIKDLKLNMVMNYQFISKNIQAISDVTRYDYYNTGKDSLAWDCIQIIGLAENRIQLQQRSPIWNCVINGRNLVRETIDRSYLTFTKSWLNGEINQDFNDILNIHIKTATLAHLVQKDIHGNEYIDWHPSKDKQYSPTEQGTEADSRCKHN